MAGDKYKLVPITSLPEATSLENFVTMGVDNTNKSVKVPIELLKGNKGDSPFVGENGNWWIGAIDTGIPTVIAVSPERGQSQTIAPTQKLFTDFATGREATIFNVSQANSKYDYPDMQTARAAVPENIRSRGQLISYSVDSEYEAVSYNETNGRGINYTNGSSFTDATRKIVRFNVKGFFKVKHRIITTSTYYGCAFYDKDGVFISGYRFLTSSGLNNGDFQEVAIPAGAVELHVTYLTDAEAVKLDVPVWDDAYVKESFSWNTEYFNGTDISQWDDDSKWVTTQEETTGTINRFINAHFTDAGKVVVVNEELRSYPNATSYTQYPMGIITESGLIGSNTNSARRWSGNIDITGYNKLKFVNLVVTGTAAHPERTGFITYAFIDASGSVVGYAENHPQDQEIIIPPGAVTFYHNIQATEYFTINITGYKLFGYQDTYTVEKNENFENLIKAAFSNSAYADFDNDFRLEFIGQKLTASQTPFSSIYYPSIIRADRYLDNPVAKYYIYFSTDHGGGTGIMMATADDIQGVWTYYGIVLNRSDQLGSAGDAETPCVIWEPVTKRFLMYWHTHDNAGGLSQNTYISQSADGLTWTYAGKAFNPKIRMFNGNGHNGYFTVAKRNGLYIGTHIITGSSIARHVRSISKDGINWITELDTQTPWTTSFITVNGEIYAINNRSEENIYLGGKIVANKVSSDFKRDIGLRFEIGQAEIGNDSMVNSFTDTDGTIYIILSENGVIDPSNPSAPSGAKALCLYKVVINDKVFKS